MESLKMKKKVSRWWKRRFTATITETDPSFKVVYLGNVLTGWAKGIFRVQPIINPVKIVSRA